MSAETIALAIYCCSLLAAVTATAANRAGNVRFREDPTYGQMFHYTTTAAADTVNTVTGRPCCGSPSSPSPSPSADPYETYYQQEIPLKFIMELNEVKNVSELFEKFMPDTDMHKAQNLVAMTGLQSRIAPNIERKALMVPKSGGCSAESQTVNLKDDDNPTLYYAPSCTRVNRCSGCCNHDLLACRPTKIETLHFEVLVSQYNVTTQKLEYVGRKPVSIIQHLKCKCDCAVQEEDCNALQIYDPDNCRCVCNNGDDYDKCIAEHSIKLWNPANCMCQCREMRECTSGFGFDYNTCRCEALRMRNRNPTNEIKRNQYT